MRQSGTSAYSTHPDDATLVAPLFGKPQRGVKHFFKTLFAKQRGWSSEAMTG
ncbi:MAG TPA: hypothetical protein VK671_00485 [Mucilaginibacter sp.]|nr:hypothetical protein [Mucilaginibacter sp.]